jgi:hypothetical protein
MSYLLFHLLSKKSDRAYGVMQEAIASQRLIVVRGYSTTLQWLPLTLLKTSV